jgi:glutathione S-transferase
MAPFPKLPTTPRPRSGPGTRPAAAASPTSTAPSPARPTRRSCRSASTRSSSIRWARPNGVKVTVMLEELLALGHEGAEYDAWLIRIGDGEQFGSGFVAINPNSKIPALLDRSGPTPIRVFESGAILVYLAEKFGAFLPTDPARARRMPVLAVLADGQRALSRRRLRAFLRLCADQDRIRHRPLRHGGEAPARRARPPAGRKPKYVAGDDYTIADIAIWPWYGGWPRGWLYGAGEFLRCRNTRTSSAGPTRSPRVPGGEARPHGQPRLQGDPAEPAARTPRRQRLRHQAPRTRGRCSGGFDRLAATGLGPVDRCGDQSRERRSHRRQSIAPGPGRPPR